MSMRISLYFAILLGVAGFAECAYALDKVDMADQVKFNEPYKCTVALLDSEIREAGSYFGAGEMADYQLEVKLLGMGPLLLVRPLGQSIEKASYIYAASSITSTCNEFLIEFEEVVPDKSWSVAALIPAKPAHRIKLKAEIFYGRPDEGEFRQLDLRAEIYSNGDVKPNDKLTMLRAARYKSPFSAKDKAATKILNKMSQEICSLVIDVTSEPKKHLECVSSMNGQ